MIDNKKIFKWLNPSNCWHENIEKWESSPCKYCGLNPLEIADSSGNQELSLLSNHNPNYTTSDGFLLLLDKLGKKRLVVKISNIYPQYSVGIWLESELFSTPTAMVIDDNLCIALAKAVIQFIEYEIFLKRMVNSYE